MKRWAGLCILSLVCLLPPSAGSLSADLIPQGDLSGQSDHLEDMDYRPESDRPIEEDESSSRRIELILGMAFIGGLLLLALFRQQARFSRRRMR
ncbi:MAG TPA: hypothetical protein ENK43_00930 [Planctomycetes bacterium]|nr:hypothetical protein [Planctomycetota bacterium]